jgi:hypothetical protein
LALLPGTSPVEQWEMEAPMEKELTQCVRRDPTGKDSYPFPPPRNTIRRFLEDEYFSSYVHPQDRWMDSDSNNLPRWLQRMIDLDKAAASSAATSANPSHPTNSFTSPVPVQHSTSTLQIPSATSEPVRKLRPRQQTINTTSTRVPNNNAPASPLVPLQMGEDFWMQRINQLEKDKRAANARAQRFENQMKLAVSRSLQLADENKQIQANHQHRLAATKRKHDEQLAGTKRTYDEMIAKTKAELEAEKRRVVELEARVKELEEHMERMHKLLDELRTEVNGRPLRYNDLYPGGVLAKHVDAFTPFPTVEQNDAFIALMNHTDGSPGSRPIGDGYLENIRPYSKVS